MLRDGILKYLIFLNIILFQGIIAGVLELFFYRLDKHEIAQRLFDMVKDFSISFVGSIQAAW